MGQTPKTLYPTCLIIQPITFNLTFPAVNVAVNVFQTPCLQFLTDFQFFNLQTQTRITMFSVQYTHVITTRYNLLMIQHFLCLSYTTCAIWLSFPLGINITSSYPRVNWSGAVGHQTCFKIKQVK